MIEFKIWKKLPKGKLELARIVKFDPNGKKEIPEAVWCKANEELIASPPGTFMCIYKKGQSGEYAWQGYKRDPKAAVKAQGV